MTGEVEPSIGKISSQIPLHTSAEADGNKSIRFLKHIQQKLLPYHVCFVT